MYAVHAVEKRNLKYKHCMKYKFNIGFLVKKEIPPLHDLIIKMIISFISFIFFNC